MNKPDATYMSVLLRRYLSGEIDRRGEAELRRLAQQDEGLAQAIAAIDAETQSDHQAALDRISRRLPRRETRRKPLLSHWSRIAAAALLLAGLAVAVLWLPGALQEGSSAMSMDSAAEPGTSSGMAPQPELKMESSPTAASREPAATPLPEQQERPAQQSQNSSTPASRDHTAIAASPPAAASALADAAEEHTPADDAPPLVYASEEQPAPAANSPAVVESMRESGMAGRTRTESTDPERMAVAETRLVRGLVLDADQRPVADALVWPQGRPLAERTDRQGYFSFQVDEAVDRIEVKAEGFKDLSLVLPQVAAAPMVADSQGGTEGVAATGVGRTFSAEESPMIDQPPMTNAEMFSRGLRPGDPGTGYDMLTIIELQAPADETKPTDDQVALSMQPPPLVEVVGGMRALRRQIAEEKPDHLIGGRLRVSFRMTPEGRMTDLQLQGGSHDLRAYVENYLRHHSQWRYLQGDEPAAITFALRF